MEALKEEKIERLHRHTHTGRPFGSQSFLDRLEEYSGQILQPRGGWPKTQAEEMRLLSPN